MLDDRCPLIIALLIGMTVGPGASQDPVAHTSAASTTAAALRAKALDLGYNLDHTEALATFKASIAA